MWRRTIQREKEYDTKRRGRKERTSIRGRERKGENDLKREREEERTGRVELLFIMTR